MKQCSKCHNDKPSSEFYKSRRSPDGRQAACKLCMKVSYNACRTKKKAHYLGVQKAREARNRQRLNEWKSRQHCAHCSENDPVCLDLHHRNPRKKDICVADAVANWSWDHLMQEIKKCIVVCANHHRKLHKGTMK